MEPWEALIVYSVFVFVMGSGVSWGYSALKFIKEYIAVNLPEMNNDEDLFLPCLLVSGYHLAYYRFETGTFIIFFNPNHPINIADLVLTGNKSIPLKNVDLVSIEKAKIFGGCAYRFKLTDRDSIKLYTIDIS